MLKLSPVLGLISGMVFVVKAGILSGEFYVQAVASFLTAGVMACGPSSATRFSASSPASASSPPAGNTRPPAEQHDQVGETPIAGQILSVLPVHSIFSADQDLRSAAIERQPGRPEHGMQ